MKIPDGDDELDFSPRDITILKVRIKYPTASVRELQATLEEKHDISLSHNRINEILREMKSKGLFRLFASPRLDLFEYYLFRVAFHFPNFEDRWEECYNDLMHDPHILFFYTADDYHQWQFITQFLTSEDSEDWKIDFIQKHGDLIAGFDKISIPVVHTLNVDARIFDDLLRNVEGGNQFLGS